MRGPTFRAFSISRPKCRSLFFALSGVFTWTCGHDSRSWTTNFHVWASTERTKKGEVWGVRGKKKEMSGGPGRGRSRERSGEQVAVCRHRKLALLTNSPFDKFCLVISERAILWEELAPVTIGLSWCGLKFTFLEEERPLNTTRQSTRQRIRSR